MIKELKFLLWDTVKKEMRQVAMLRWEPGPSPSCIAAYWDDDTVHNSFTVIEPGDERFVLMQYTGLHDQNDAEIYEPVFRQNRAPIVSGPEDHMLYGLEEQIRALCSDFRWNPFDNTKIPHCRLNKRMVAAIVLLIEQKCRESYPELLAAHGQSGNL